MGPTHALGRIGTALLTTAALALSPAASASFPAVSAPLPAAPAAAAAAARPPAVAGAAGHRGPVWRGAWAASPQPPSARSGPDWSRRGFDHHTLRQVVRVTTGGSLARIELSNRYGTAPLRISGATLARTARTARTPRTARTGAVDPRSVRALRFGGKPYATVPPGGTLYSDAVRLPVSALEPLTVTLHLADRTGPATFHRLSSATSYRVAGDHLADVSGAAFRETSTSWYYLSGIEVADRGGRDGGGHDPDGRPSGRRGGIVAFGDSITDGSGSTTDADARYPDELAERLAAAGLPRAVLNHGISGNRVLADTPQAGEKALDRFRKDVLTEPGVRTVVLLEGINDIGTDEGGPAGRAALVARLAAAHRTLVREARAKGLRVVGATLTPIKGSLYDTPDHEAKRDALNHWIRTSGAYDAVVDFDRALADPADPDRIRPAYDSGDGLHPNDAGYRAMARALDPDRL